MGLNMNMPSPPKPPKLPSAVLKPVKEQDKDGASEHEYAEQESSPPVDDLTAYVDEFNGLVTESRVLKDSHEIKFIAGSEITTAVASIEGDDRYGIRRKSAVRRAREEAVKAHEEKFGKISNWLFVTENVVHLNNHVAVDIIQWGR